jgi:2-polyprenyl-6-methoxyphenol hydroxylase-like FAD-dependent oxidoreductase
MKKPHLLIVGAGPSGLIAALTAQALQFPATVFEKRKQNDLLGGGIALQSNGLRVLDSLGLLSSFKNRLNLVAGGLVKDTQGGTLSAFDYETISIPHNHMAIVRRSELQDYLMRQVLEKNIPIFFEKSCVSISDNSNQKILHFSDGSSIAGDLVLACDGIHSAVRSSCGLEAKKKSAGKAFLRGVSKYSFPEKKVVELWGLDGRRFGIGPLASDCTYFYCSVPLGRWGHIRAHQLEDWIQGWRSFGPEVEQILRRVPDWDLVNYDEISELYLDQWYRNRVFFCGDSAHAMTPDLGQGANSAMTDVFILIQMLNEAYTKGIAWDQVGQHYQALRKPFVQKIQKQSRLSSEFSDWTSPLMRMIRPALFFLLNTVPSLKRHLMYLSSGYQAKENVYFKVPLSV